MNLDNAKSFIERKLRERRERKAAKLEMAQTKDHHHGRFFLLHVPAIATILAAVTEVYWAILFCIEATGQIDGNIDTASGSNVPGSFVWNFAFSGHLPVLIGLAAATAPIVMISMVWLPVQFAMRGFGRWRRGTLIAVGLLANALVIVSGTVVMNHSRQDQVRDAVVVEQTAAQGRTAIDARLTFEQEQLRLALANANPYLNQAANVGAAEWERSYVAQARATNDPRLPQLERALGAARAADERRANIERLTVERATAAPEAASAAVVEDTVGRDLNTFAQIVEVWRPPFVALIATLIGVLGSWWTLAMMQGMNPRDVLRSGWADEAHRIEDHSQEAPLPVDERGPVPPRQRRKVYNPETGKEEVFVQPKGYWRSTGKKQKNADGTEGELTEFIPDAGPEDKPAAQDGGNRAGSVTIGGLMAAVPPEGTEHAGPQEHNSETEGESFEKDGMVIHQPNETADTSNPSGHDQGGEDSILNHLDLSEELPAYEPEETNTEPQDAEIVESVQEENAEPDQQREPETDPARLISHVAAE